MVRLGHKLSLALTVILIPTTALCGQLLIGNFGTCNKKLVQTALARTGTTSEIGHAPFSKEDSLLPKKIQTPPSLDSNHEYSPLEKQYIDAVLESLYAAGGGPILLYHLKAMHFRLDLLDYALDTYAEGKPAKLIQDILNRSPNLIHAINSEAEQRNLGKGAEAADFGRGRILASTDSEGRALYRVGKLVAVGRQNLTSESRLALYSGLLSAGAQVQIQVVEYESIDPDGRDEAGGKIGRGAQREKQILREGRVAYISGQNGNYQIGFESDGTYFQYHWDSINFLTMADPDESLIVDLNKEFKQAIEGRAYEQTPFTKNDSNIEYNQITQNVPEARKILDRLTANEQSQEFYKDLEFVRGIRLILAFDYYKAYCNGRYPGKENMPYIFLMNAIKSHDRRVIKYINDILGTLQFLPDTLARFPRPPNKFGL